MSKSPKCPPGLEGKPRPPRREGWRPRGIPESDPSDKPGPFRQVTMSEAEYAVWRAENLPEDDGLMEELDKQFDEWDAEEAAKRAAENGGDITCATLEARKGVHLALEERPPVTVEPNPWQIIGD